MVARINKVGGLIKVFTILYEFLSGDYVNNGSFDELGSELVVNGDFEELSPELITNGSFDTDSNWTKQSGWSIANGVATFDINDYVSGSTNVYQSALIVGKEYILTYDVVDYVQGNVRNVSTGAPIMRTANGTYTEQFTANNTTLFLNCSSAQNTILSIDNVSVKQVDPNDDWTKVDSIISDGKGNLDSTSSTSILFQQNTLTVGKTYKATFDVSNYNGVGVCALINSSGTTQFEITSDGNVDFYFTHSGNSANLSFRATAGGVFSIDNVSVKQVDPNDAWTIEDVWTIQDGVASGNGANSVDEELNQNISSSGILIGSTVKCSFEIKNYVSGSVQVIGISNTVSRSSNGIYEFQGDITSFNIRFRGAAFYGDVTNLSIQEVLEDAQNTDTTYISPKDLSLKFKANEMVLGSEFLEKGIFIPVENVQDENGTAIGDEADIVTYIDSLT